MFYHDLIMINLVFVDSELETIPVEMQKERDVLAIARKRGKPVEEMVLDSSIMHRAIDRVFPGESNRRGRPDVFHIMLNVAQSSILNLLGMLRVYILTRNSDLIEISPVTRIPKNYARFLGLVEDLYKKGEIKSDRDTLLRIRKNIVLKQFIDSLGGKKILLDPLGEHKKPSEIFQGVRDCTIVIGGFANGTFRSDLSFIEDKISIYPEELTIWTIAAEIICQCERDFDLA